MLCAVAAAPGAIVRASLNSADLKFRPATYKWKLVCRSVLAPHAKSVEAKAQDAGAIVAVALNAGVPGGTETLNGDAHAASDALLIRGDDFAQILWVHARSERRRPNQIGEHHCDLAAFSGVLWAPLYCGRRLGLGLDRTRQLRNATSLFRRCPSKTPMSLRS